MKNVLIFMTLVVMTSCNYNKEELPEPEAVVAPTSPPVTYNLHTKRLFDTYCIDCHAAGQTQQNFPLTTYSEVTVGNYSNANGNIENRVLIQENMPPSGASTGFLTPAEKDTLQWWIDQGAPQ